MQFPFGPDSDDENDKKNKNGGDRESGKRVNPLGNPFLVRAMEQRAEAKGAALEAEPMGAMDLSMKMGRQLLDQARRKEGPLGERLRGEMETAGFSFGSRGAIGFKDPKERARGEGKSTSIALTPGRGAKRQEGQPMQTTEMVRSALNRPFGGEGARNQGDPLAFLNARLPDTDEDDLLEAEGLISAAETTLAEQSANADDPLTAKLIATRAEEAKAMMAALAGEKAIRETSVPSPSFETVTASPPQDEGVSGTAPSPHPEEPRSGVSKGQERLNNPFSKDEGGIQLASTDNNSGTTGVAAGNSGSASQAATKPQSKLPESDPPADFDAERNEAPAQADAQERESDLQPFGEPTRRNLEDIERAQADLERQRQRQRAILDQSAEERDDPAMRPQRQQAVAKDIEEAQRNLGKAQVKARDDILERISQGNIGDEEAFLGAQAIFGKDAPPTRQVAIAIWAKNSQQESFSNPARAGEAGDLIDDLRGRAGAKGDLSDEAVEFFNDKQEKLNELKTQAASVIEAQAESERLNGEIDALRRDLIGTGDPGRRTKLERELSEKAAAFGAASDALSNTRDVYETAAADFGKLQAANNLAKLVEASDPQTARNQVLDLAKAVRDNVVGGGIAGAAIGSSGAGPAGGVVGGAFGSFLGVVSAVTGNLAARAALSADDLEALPRLLAEDPKAAIEVIDKIGDAELVSLLAGSLVGGISTTSRSGFSIIDALAGASAAKVSEKLFK
jgi:uncharacterized membrane protein